MRDWFRRFRPFQRFLPALVAASGAALLLSIVATRALADSDEAPIHYNSAPVDDPIARLQREIDRGAVTLDYADARGYLDALLKHLNIPASSQGLVFSKTSFQRNLISSHKPRALYFNDDGYVGFVRGGPVLEIASIDKNLGTVFYTLKQEKQAKPKFIRQTYECLQCHESGMTQNVPGLLMRSIYPDIEGQPILSAGTFVSNDQSPLAHRWGGWYVTGESGAQQHMGNVTCDDEDHADQTDFSPGRNVTSLSKYLKTTPYPSDTSDIVALMVLAHQSHVHNLITRANYDTRTALRDSDALNKALGEAPGTRSESTRHRIQSACEPLVAALLFSGEATLTDPIKGTSGFAEDFAKRGPRDGQGRSLRDFDLTHRLFKFPCSYLIYSEQFDALPPEASAYVYQRLSDILTGTDNTHRFAHLTAADRAAIIEILRSTKSNLPKGWG